MYKLLSGAKSVKQYRGDENLPEAKKGMKNCGCKHSRNKYKYQAGTKATKSKGLVMEDLYSEMGELTGNKPEKLLRSAVIVDKNTNKAIIRAKDARNNKTVNVLTGQNRDINARDENVSSVAQLDKNPKGRVTPTGYYTLDPNSITNEDKKNFHGNVAHLKPIPANNRRAPKSYATAFHETYDPKVRNPLYGTNKANASYGCVNITPGNYKYCMQNLENNDTLAVFDSRRPRDRDLLSRYQAVTEKAKGANALTIPEGSAIVTANGGKNKQAISAYKKGNYKLLNKIIEDMPEDKPNGKNQIGNNFVDVMKNPLLVSDVLKKNVKPGFYSDTVQAPAPGYTTNRTPSKQRQMELEYEKDPKSFEKKYGKTATSLQKERMQAVANKQETFKWSNNNKEYKSGFTIDKKEPAKSIVPLRPSTDTSNNIQAIEDKKVDTNKEDLTNKRKGNFLSNVPAMAEIAARTSILGQGIEGVPENYLKLDRYNYASQLPATLREIQLSEQAGRETARDIVGGDAGRYLAQAGSLSASRMKVANQAVIQDTLARQDILNKNVDLGNVESQTNRSLKDQYAALRGQARANYNDQLVSLGQRIDSATETSQKMANQKNVDETKLNLLKTGKYKMDSEGNIIFIGKNGAKKLKTYKRK